jgi:hypothetical protein
VVQAAGDVETWRTRHGHDGRPVCCAETRA